MQTRSSRLNPSGAASAGVLALVEATTAAKIGTTSAGNTFASFRVDVEDWELYLRRLFFEVVISWATLNTAPAVNGWGSLWPVTALTGVAGDAILTLGPEVVGSRTTPRALSAGNTIYGPDRSSGFELAASGLYILAATVDAGFAVNSAAAVHVRLQARTQ